MTTHKITNYEFGDAIGCDFTMASRVRRGERLPSRDLLANIVKAYNLDANDALDACVSGEEFAKYLDEMIFNPLKVDDADDPADPNGLADDVTDESATD